jgi:hypothetical protein
VPVVGTLLLLAITRTRISVLSMSSTSRRGASRFSARAISSRLSVAQTGQVVGLRE